MRLRLACLLCLAFLVTTVVGEAISTATSSSTPTVSSTTVVQKGFAYTPSKAAAAVFTGLYGITTLVVFVRLFANRAWWGLCLPIGTTFMTLGFLLRVAMLMDQNSFSIYLSSTLFILLSPAAFLAFNYILYGRFVVNCIDRRHSLIRPERTARYFVISDITTFTIQGSGGSLLASTNPHMNNIGYYIVITGLALQTLSYTFYIYLVHHAFRRLKRDGLEPFDQPWGTILKLIFFSSVFFLLRCVYRTIEFGQGLQNGYFIQHEVFFYVFDSFPLLIGINAYTLFWPSRYLHAPSDTAVPASSSSSSSSSDEKSTVVSSAKAVVRSGTSSV